VSVKTIAIRPPDALVDRVAALERQVRALEAERDARRRRLSLDDRRCLASVLPALSGCWGPEQFSVRDVFDDPRLVRLVAGRSPKALGKLFARASGSVIGAYVLADGGPEAAPRRWRVDGAD
jgi:hypothetical protein